MRHKILGWSPSKRSHAKSTMPYASIVDSYPVLNVPLRVQLRSSLPVYTRYRFLHPSKHRCSSQKACAKKPNELQVRCEIVFRSCVAQGCELVASRYTLKNQGLSNVTRKGEEPSPSGSIVYLATIVKISVARAIHIVFIVRVVHIAIHGVSPPSFGKFVGLFSAGVRLNEPSTRVLVRLLSVFSRPRSRAAKSRVNFQQKAEL